MAADEKQPEREKERGAEGTAASKKRGRRNTQTKRPRQVREFDLDVVVTQSVGRVCVCQCVHG